MRVIDQITKPTKKAATVKTEPIKESFFEGIQKKVEQIELKKIKKRVSKKIKLLNIGVPLLIVGGFAMTLLSYRLFSLPTDVANTQEVISYQQSSSFRTVVDSGPIHLMPKLSNLALHAFTANPLAGRITSVVIGFVAIISFFLVCRSLFGERLSVAASILFTSSTFFLALVRSGEPYSNFLSLFILFAFTLLVFRKNQTDWLLVPLSLLFLWLITTPGGIFVVATMIGLKIKWLVRKIKESSKVSLITSILLLVIGAALLIYSGLQASSTKLIIKELVGVPVHLDIYDSIKNLYYIPKAILYGFFPGDWQYWLGGQPILDALSSFLFIFGVYHILRTPKLQRFSSLLTIFGVVSIWIAFSDNMLHIITLLPFIYLVIGFGLQAVVFEWRKIFPKNVLARSIGLGVIGIVLLIGIWFQSFRYFIVQPKTPEVKNSYLGST